MPSDIPTPKSLTTPYWGAAIVGAALVFPLLRLPLVLGCLAALGNAALGERQRCGRVEDVVPETPPLTPRRRPRGRRTGEDSVADASEDSFPASDPPSWTPVTGTRTRH